MATMARLANMPKRGRPPLAHAESEPSTSSRASSLGRQPETSGNTNPRRNQHSRTERYSPFLDSVRAHQPQTQPEPRAQPPPQIQRSSPISAQRQSQLAVRPQIKHRVLPHPRLFPFDQTRSEDTRSPRAKYTSHSEPQTPTSQTGFSTSASGGISKDPNRPNGLYQPSRGAQRDAKWRAKLAQSKTGKGDNRPRDGSAPILDSGSSSRGGSPYTYELGLIPRGQTQNGYYGYNDRGGQDQLDPENDLDVEVNSDVDLLLSVQRTRRTISKPNGALDASRMVPNARTALYDQDLPLNPASANDLPPPPPPPPPMFTDPWRSAHTPEAETTQRLFQEQQAAVALAREAYQREMQQQAILKDEYERKTKMIQLQVFVHARPTYCEWQGCQATLNSWAVLEKHIYHSHLHPCQPNLPPPGKALHCRWFGCDQVFGTREECYNHCLLDHMVGMCARCPFDCLYEGPAFSELMAHIARRHPQSTPNDFVPGLIHFQPTLPPLTELPALPTNTVIPFAPIRTAETPLGQDIVILRNRPSQKAISAVLKGCVSSGKRPRPEGWVDKRGDLAAIGAIIEDCKLHAEAKLGPEEGAEDIMAQTPLEPEAIRKEAIRVARAEIRLRQSSTSTTGSTTCAPSTLSSDSESSENIILGPRPSALRRTTGRMM